MPLTEGKALQGIFLLMCCGIRMYSSGDFLLLVPVEIRGSRKHLNKYFSSSFPYFFIF